MIQIVERNSQLETLHATLRSIGRGGGRIVLLHGEAGIGKSTLIDRFVGALPPEQRVGIGYCDLLQTPRPLGPVREVARMLLPAARRGMDDTACFDVLLDHFLSLRAPVVVVLEDLHWADHKSLEWLRFIGRRIAQLPVLLIGSYRDDEVDETHPLRLAIGGIPAPVTLRMPLEPLSVDGVRALMGQSALGAERVHQITSGNAFFVTELLAGTGAATEVPERVADAVNARISTLPAPVQDLLELLSCCPGDIPAELFDDPGFEDLIHLARRRNILTGSGGQLRFRHVLARRAIHEKLPPTRRRNANKRLLAAYLAAPDPKAHLDSIVHHACGAGDGQAVLDYAPRAARQAAQLGAHREAALHYQSAQEYLAHADAETAAEIQEGFAYEAALALQIDDQVIAARQAAIDIWRRLDRPGKVGENLAALSRVHWYRGEAERAGALIREATDLLDQHAPGATAARAKSEALRAQFFMLQDRMEEATEGALRAVALAKEAGDVETRSHALNSLGCAMMFRGQLEGEDFLRDSLRLSLTHGFHEQAARVYTNLSECLIEARALKRADALLEEGIAFDTAHDLDAWTYYLIGRKAQLRFEQDRYDEAALICESVLQQGGQTLLMQMPARLILARAALRLGREDAAGLLETARDAAEQIAEPQYLAPAHITALEMAVLEGSPAQEALDWFDGLAPGLLSPRKSAEVLLWRSMLGHPGDRQGDLPAPFIDFLDGRYDRAAAGFADEEAHYLAAWAQALNGQHAEADGYFAATGALTARQGLRRIFADAPLPGLARGPYAASRAHPYGLTAKEQSVLTHMVRGQSNAEIAEDLSRSIRTVENHVSSILHKLGCARRLDVALMAQSEPWILPAEN